MFGGWGSLTGMSKCWLFQTFRQRLFYFFRAVCLRKVMPQNLELVFIITWHHFANKCFFITFFYNPNEKKNVLAAPLLEALNDNNKLMRQREWLHGEAAEALCTFLSHVNHISLWIEPWKQVISCSLLFLDSPRGHTPLWWWGSPGWMETLGGSSAASPPSSGSSLVAGALPSGWIPAAGSACPFLWQRRSGSGRERPWAPPPGMSSSPPPRRSGWTRLEEKGGEDQPLRLRETWDKWVKALMKRRSSSSSREVQLTWRVALPLYFGAEGDRTWRAEPAAQRFLLCTSLRSLFTHSNLI